MSEQSGSGDDFNKDVLNSVRQEYLESLLKVFSAPALGPTIDPKIEISADLAENLARELTAAIAGSPSPLFKSSEEACATPTALDAAMFETSKQKWDRRSQNSLYVLKALQSAHASQVTPPAWALEVILKACARSLNNGGLVTINEALDLKPKAQKKETQKFKQELIANMVAEGLDSGLSSSEARELANLEMQYVFNDGPFTHDTIQSYYERYNTTRDGFRHTFMASFLICGKDVTLGTAGERSKPNSIDNTYIRKGALKIRLHAYREAEEFGTDKTNILTSVVNKTIYALSLL
jgi:hypothetical protein